MLLLEVDEAKLPGSDQIFIDVVNIVVLAAFAIDYGVGFALTDDRRAYVKGGG